MGEKSETLANILRPELEEQKVEDVWAVVKGLPDLTVSVEMDGQKVQLGRQMESKTRWITVTAKAEVKISITMRRVNRRQEGVKVYAPKYQTPKDEGWVVIVGNPDNRELAALKRVGPVRSSTTLSLVVLDLVYHV